MLLSPPPLLPSLSLSLSLFFESANGALDYKKLRANGTRWKQQTDKKMRKITRRKSVTRVILVGLFKFNFYFIYYMMCVVFNLRRASKVPREGPMSSPN